MTAGATLVLALVFSLVYYVSTHQRPASRANYIPASANTTQPTPAESQSTEIKTTASEVNETEKKVTPIAVETKTAKAPVSKSSVGITPKEIKDQPKAKPQKTQSSTQTPEPDSKIGSILKKTGRLIKKPFKF